MKRSYLLFFGLVAGGVLSAFGCGGVSSNADALFSSGSTGGSSTSSTDGSGGDPTTSVSSGGGNGGASSASSSSSSSSSGGISCGDTTCPLGGDSACCWDNFQTNAAPFAECVDAPADSDGCRTFVANDGLETRIECQLGSQCPDGNTCCAHREFFNNNNSFYDTVRCEPGCDWPDVVLCDASDAAFPCPEVFTQGQQVQTTCKPSSRLPPGYTVCGP